MIRSRCRSLGASDRFGLGIKPIGALDVALLHVEALTDIGVQPIELVEGAVDSSWIGEEAVIAGFGITESGTWGQLRVADEHIVAITEHHVVVDGLGKSGACIGDSGGPLLSMHSDGTVQVLGTLDEGDPSCLGRDHYVRADLIAEWARGADEALQQLPADGGRHP